MTLVRDLSLSETNFLTGAHRADNLEGRIRSERDIL